MKRWLHHLLPESETCCRHSDGEKRRWGGGEEGQTATRAARIHTSPPEW